MDRMKPCPFCGDDDPSVIRNYARATRTFIYYVECELCGAKTKAFGSRDGFDTEPDWDSAPARRAVSAWNRRDG